MTDDAIAGWGPEGLEGVGLAESRRRHTPAEPTPEFLALIEALRTLQDDITAAAPPGDVVAAAATTLAEVSARLRPYAVPEREQITGHLSSVPGRGQAMAPVVRVEEWTDTRVTGRVTFGRFYLGGNGAVHGGAIPLMFDELLGRLANAGGRSISRTAYLHVNYRSITPVGADLAFEGHFDREEGRKRFLVATLHDGDTLCADAEGLFVALNPGQP